MRLPIFVVGVVAVGAAAFLIWPKQKKTEITVSQPPTVTKSPETIIGKSLELPTKTITGRVLLPEDPNLRVLVTLNGNFLVDIPANGNFNLVLPSKLNGLVPLNDLKLVHGPGKLKGSDGAVGGSVRFEAYSDSDGDKKYSGEQKTVMQLSKRGLDVNYQGFFRYQLIVISSKANLKGKKDSDTGAKDYYSYDLDLNKGWHVLQGEFGANGYGYGVTKVNTEFDLLPFTLPSLRGNPQFTP